MLPQGLLTLRDPHEISLTSSGDPAAGVLIPGPVGDPTRAVQITRRYSHAVFFYVFSSADGF